MTYSIRQSVSSRFISLFLTLTFVTTMVIAPKADADTGVLGLPQPGTMMNLSPSYVPLMLTGLTVHPENPLLMDFIVSTGNSGLNADQVKVQSDRLIKYFLACLTIPENNQWVNLSPYEKQRIIPDDLGQTVLGRDMLAQDYILKQLTASLIYPEKNLGKSFWEKVYSKAVEMYGTTKIPVNTFNKVWILPQYAKVYTHNNTVFVVKSHLKVMLDEDYLAMTKHQAVNTTNNLGNQIVRQVILPAIEQEVNTGKNFAQMRQIYNSMLLAVWFKNNLKEALLNQVYANKSKVNGVNVDDPAIKEKIYQQYLQAYKKGVFNYIKEENDPSTNQVIPRKYFSGGLVAPTEGTYGQATSEDILGREESDSQLDDKYFKVFGLSMPASRAMTVNAGRLSFNINEEDLAAKGVRVARVENGKTIVFTRNDGKELSFKVKNAGNLGDVFEFGNLVYVVKDDKQPIAFSDINLLGNQEALDFLGVKVDSLNPDSFHFSLPIDDPSLKRQTDPFPVSSLQPSLLTAEPSADVVNHARNVVEEALQNLQTGINVYELLHNATILGMHGKQKGSSEDYYRVMRLLNAMEQNDLYTQQRPLIVSLSDYLRLSYVAVDWKLWKDISERRRKETTSPTSAPSTRTKTMFELSVEETRLPVDDPQNWSIESVKALGNTDVEPVPQQPDDKRVQLGEEAIRKGQIVAVPFAGGSGTTAKPFTKGVNKLVYKIFQAVIEKDGVVRPGSQWLSPILVRLGLLVGQNSRIIVPTSVDGPRPGGSDEVVNQLLNDQYPQLVKEGKISDVRQRVGLPLNQQGYPMRYKDGHVATVAENHLWAFMSVLLNKDLMIDVLKHSSGILSMGNGDNILNYTRPGMVGTILASRGTNRPVGTVAITTPSAIDRKGGIAVAVTYKSRITGKTITQNEFREISEFATRDKKKSGFDAIDFANEDTNSEIYRSMDEKKLFIEDLFNDEQGHPKEVAFNVAFYAVDVRLMIARIFGLDENDPDLVGKLEKIDSQKWVDTLQEFAKQVPTTIKPAKKAPSDDGADTVTGYSFEQAVQDFIVNALALLKVDGKPTPIAEFLSMPRSECFLPIKYMKQAPLNNDGSPNLSAAPVLDVVGQQPGFVKAITDLQKKGLPIVLGNGERVSEVVKANTFAEIQQANGQEPDINSNAAMTTEMSIGQEALPTIEKGVFSPAKDQFMRGLMTGEINPKADNAMTLKVETKRIDPNVRAAKFGTSGDRGRIDMKEDGKDANGLEGADFNIGLVRKDTKGVAEHLLATTTKRTIIMGYDARHRNPEFSKEAASIMAGYGFKVIYVAHGPIPTPVLAYLTTIYDDVAGVLNFTASHSPHQDGGLKFSPSHGGAADMQTTDSIVGFANSGNTYKIADYKQAVQQGAIVELDPQEAVTKYVDNYLIPILNNTKGKDGRSAWDDITGYIKSHPKFKLFVDPLQGTGVGVDRLLFQKMAADVGRDFYEIIHANNKDPYFREVAGAPQPAGKYIQGLVDAVKADPNAVGIAQDGDVDRFGVVDKGGQQKIANVMMALFAWFLKQDVGLEDYDTVVKTVATSDFVVGVANRLGLKVIEVPVGFKNVVEQVINGKKVLVGGEESAHIALGPFMKTWDDGFVVGLTALWILAKTGKSLGEYQAYIEGQIGKKYVTEVATERDDINDGYRKEVTRKIDLYNSEASQGIPLSDRTFVKAVKKEVEKHPELNQSRVMSVNSMDGLKLSFDNGDSILMRNSGTEPAAKWYVEVSNPNRLQALSQVAKAFSADKAMVFNAVSGAEDDEDTLSTTSALTPVNTDNTALAKENGGIDLNSRTLNMESSGDKVNITFNQAMVAQFRRGDFSGVRIKILDVMPINLIPLLGLRKEDAVLALR